LKEFIGYFDGRREACKCAFGSVRYERKAMKTGMLYVGISILFSMAVLAPAKAGPFDDLLKDRIKQITVKGEWHCQAKSYWRSGSASGRYVVSKKLGESSGEFEERAAEKREDALQKAKAEALADCENKKVSEYLHDTACNGDDYCRGPDEVTED
jgi:hypothetical protein